MSRISFRKNGEEHNFWQNYTDLMSGFLIVFIIASLVTFKNYTNLEGEAQKCDSIGNIFNENGIPEDSILSTIIKAREHDSLVKIFTNENIPTDSSTIIDMIKLYGVYIDFHGREGRITAGRLQEIVINSDLFQKIREFYETQKTINRQYFRYNKDHERFECTVDVTFAPDSPVIPTQCRQQLLEAGREVERIIEQFRKSTNVSFKVVIEGRAAQRHNTTPTVQQRNYAARLSYERARNLYAFWKDRGLFQDIEGQNGEIFISGSGYEGRGRYRGYGPNGEDRNKTFIIQIIPYIIY